jgi:hypothetical protein
MSTFRHTPSHRRKPKPTASWLVVGYDTSRDILYHGRTAHILPVRSTDHRKRYHEGQRLAVKAFVGGPNECRINVLAVDRIQVQDIDYPTARALGYIRVDQFREDWEKPHQWVWVIRFVVDRTAAPRLLALHSEDLYVENITLALPDEPEALSEDDWKRHVEGNRDLTHDQWIALSRASELGQRRRLPKHQRAA